MKNLILCITLVNCLINASAQTLSSGSYSSNAMGYTYTTIVKQDGDIITITEPNRINIYKSNGDNIYYHTEEKYSNYYIKVIPNNKYFAGKQGSQEQLFTFSENSDEEVLLSGIDNCPLYDKYLMLAQTDETEVQAWAFCGVAALAKCTYTDVENYLEPVIKALKSITADRDTCPCTDVITQLEWNAVITD